METSRPPGFGKETMLIAPQVALSLVNVDAWPYGDACVPQAISLGYCFAYEVCVDRVMPPATPLATDGHAARISDPQLTSAAASLSWRPLP